MTTIWNMPTASIGFIMVHRAYLITTLGLTLGMDTEVLVSDGLAGVGDQVGP